MFWMASVFLFGNIDDEELSAFGDGAKARRLNLDIHIETSASDKASIDEAVAIAFENWGIVRTFLSTL